MKAKSIKAKWLSSKFGLQREEEVKQLCDRATDSCKNNVERILLIDYLVDDRRGSFAVPSLATYVYPSSTVVKLKVGSKYNR